MNDLFFKTEMPEISDRKDSNCKCFNPPFNAADFKIREVGSDEKYAEISIETCQLCGQKWLRYFYENEAFSRSGRWFRGRISDSESRRITTENAVNYLENLDWYFIGGSYFDSTGKISKGKINL